MKKRDKSENDKISKRLKELRTVHNMKQVDVATAIGVIRQTYAHYETGIRTPSAETIYKLANLYKIPADNLLQLIITDDENVYNDEPAPQIMDDLSEYADFIGNPDNRKKYLSCTDMEKQLLFYFSKIHQNIDKQELIEIAKLKAKKDG